MEHAWGKCGPRTTVSCYRCEDRGEGLSVVVELIRKMMQQIRPLDFWVRLRCNGGQLHQLLVGCDEGVVVPTTSFIYFGSVVRASSWDARGRPTLAGGTGRGSPAPEAGPLQGLRLISTPVTDATQVHVATTLQLSWLFTCASNCTECEDENVKSATFACSFLSILVQSVILGFRGSCVHKRQARLWGSSLCVSTAMQHGDKLRSKLSFSGQRRATTKHHPSVL